MSSEEEEVEKNQQQHAQLLTELPRADGFIRKEVYLYQGFWVYPTAILSIMMMQNHFMNHQWSTDMILLSSFMKSGTTWLKSLIFTTLNRSLFEFSDHPLLRMGPHECFTVLDHNKLKETSFSSSRLFATHLPHKLLPSSITDPSSGCKLVYVCRDPKDMLVSLWHFIFKVRPKELQQVSFDRVFQSLCDGVIEYGPYWDHVLGYWKASLKSPNKVLFFKYEEIKREPEVHVKKLAEFMGVPISVQEEENGMVKKIVEFCSLEHLTNLQITKTGNSRFPNGLVIPNHAFFRRGEVGDWKCHLTQEMKDQIDRITCDKFKDSGLTFGATPN